MEYRKQDTWIKKLVNELLSKNIRIDIRIDNVLGKLKMKT